MRKKNASSEVKRNGMVLCGWSFDLSKADDILPFPTHFLSHFQHKLLNIIRVKLVFAHDAHIVYLFDVDMEVICSHMNSNFISFICHFIY